MKPSQEIEAIARIIAKRHFDRKELTSASGRAARLKYLVDTYWEHWRADAVEVIVALDELRKNET